jgi:hypothetical protein
MEFYPVSPAAAILAGCEARGVLSGIAAVRPGGLRRPGRGGVSALVAGPDAGQPVSAGEDLVFCHQVTVAPAVVRRSGELLAGGGCPIT